MVGRLDRERPVPAHLHRSGAVELEREVMSCRQAPDRASQRARCRDEAVGEELLHRLAVDVARYAGMLEQRRELGGECEEPRRGVVVERLLAEAVAREEEPPPA